QVLSSPDNIASQLEVLLRLQASNDADENSAEQAVAGSNREHSVDMRIEPNGVGAKQRIYIIPARSLVQRVLDKQTLQANTFTLTTGQEIDRDNLANQLINLGYKREALVTLR